MNESGTSGTGTTTTNNTPSNNTQVNNTPQNLYTNSQTNTPANNVSKNNTSTMPATGIDDTAVYIMIIFAISAIFAYKKMKDYKLK